MSGSISQSFQSNFLAGLRSFFNSPLNGSQTTPEANQASAKNPSPAAPKKLNLLEKIQNLFAFFKPTKIVPVAPQALGSNAGANTSQRSDQLAKAMGELNDLGVKQKENNEALRQAQKSLEEIEVYDPSRWERFGSSLRGGADSEKFIANRNREIEKLQVTIDQCTERQTALSQEVTQLSRLVAQLR